MDYITELYEDGMHYYVERRRCTPEYRALYERRRKAAAELRSMLVEKQRDLLSDVLEMQIEMNGMTAAAAFREGFRLCAGLVRELDARPVSVRDAVPDDEEAE